MKPGEMKIFKALMDHEQGLTFTELKKETKLSAPVLSEYLKTFQVEGSINKNVAIRKYQLTRAYLPKAKLFGIEKSVCSFVFSAPTFAMKIKKVKNEAKKTELVRQFLKIYLMFGSSLITFGVIMCALGEWFDKGNEKTDSLSSILNEQIGNWITPYIQKLALALIFIEEDVEKNEATLDEICETLHTEMMICIDKMKKIGKAEQTF